MKQKTAKRLLSFGEKEYDTYAREFSDTRPFFWKELGFLERYARFGQNVLDIGCGNGRLLDLFSNKDIRYTGIDSSKEMIAIAQKHRGEKGTFLHANALEIPLPDESFDTVFSIAVLHHIPSQNYRKTFVREISRVLRPDGTLVLTVWNTLQWKFFVPHLIHTVKKIFFLSDMDIGDMIISFGQQKKKRYVHTFTERGLRTLLEKQGFTVSSIENIQRRSGYANMVIVAKKGRP